MVVAHRHAAGARAHTHTHTQREATADRLIIINGVLCQCMWATCQLLVLHPWSGQGLLLFQMAHLADNAVKIKQSEVNSASCFQSGSGQIQLNEHHHRTFHCYFSELYHLYVIFSCEHMMVLSPTLALAYCCVAVYLISSLKYSLAVALCPDVCPQIFCSCRNSFGFLSSNTHPLLEVYSLFPSQILLNCCTLMRLPLQNVPLLAVAQC